MMVILYRSSMNLSKDYIYPHEPDTYSATVHADDEIHLAQGKGGSRSRD